MTEDQFDRLAQLIKTTHDDLSTRIDAIEIRMTEGFSSIQADLRAIRQELSIVDTRLAHLEERSESNAGFAKEIDVLRHDITLIKQKLQLA